MLEQVKLREKKQSRFSVFVQFYSSFFRVVSKNRMTYKQINYGSDTLGSEDFIDHPGLNQVPF